MKRALSREVLTNLVDDFSTDPRGNPGFDFLIDLSGVTAIKMNFRDMQALVDYQNRVLRDRANYSKTALFAPDNLTFGLARMYEAFTDSLPVDFSVFKDVDSAFLWLGKTADLMDDLESYFGPDASPGNER